MMTDHSRRAAVMYPVKTASTEAARSPATTGRAAAGAILYGASKSGQVGSIDNAVASAFDRIESTVRDDKERLSQTQHARRTAKSLLEKANVAPSDAHTLLSTYHESRSLDRSEEAIAKHWQGTDGFDRLRREAGSTEAAMKQLAAAEAVLTVIRKEDPLFAADLVRTGASTDPRFIQTAAKIVESISKPKEQAI
jgi:hypothetical protein